MGVSPAVARLVVVGRASFAVGFRRRVVSILTFATPSFDIPICWAAACERSIFRPFTYGPRSLIFTVTDFPVSRLVTTALLPMGKVAMCRGELLLIERFSTRGLFPVERCPVPGRVSDLLYLGPLSVGHFLFHLGRQHGRRKSLPPTHRQRAARQQQRKHRFSDSKHDRRLTRMFHHCF